MKGLNRRYLYPVPGALLLVMFAHGFPGGPGQFKSRVPSAGEAGAVAESIVFPSYGFM